MFGYRLQIYDISLKTTNELAKDYQFNSYHQLRLPCGTLNLHQSYKSAATPHPSHSCHPPPTPPLPRGGESGEAELSSPHTLSPHPSPLSPHPLRGGVGGGVRGRGSIFLAERIILTPPPAPPLSRGGESGETELPSPSQGRGERRNGTFLTFPRAGKAAKRNSPPLKGRGRGRGM